MSPTRPAPTAAGEALSELSPAEIARRERRVQRICISAIVAFFGVQACLWACALWFTSRDDSFAIISDYERRSDSWEQLQAELRASRQLGWRVSVDQTLDASGQPAISLRLIDAQAQPVEGAELSVVMFHGGRAAIKQQLAAQESEPGTYLVRPTIDRDGRWKMMGKAVVGQQQLVIDRDCYLKATHTPIGGGAA
jgi:nitrogen fixation protein FixH